MLKRIFYIFSPICLLFFCLQNVQADSRFTAYVGGYGGVTIPAYQLSAEYISFNTAQEGEKLNATFTPISSEEGADAGFLINFLHRYSIGLEYNFTSYNKPDDRYVTPIDSTVSDVATSMVLIQTIRLNYANDVLFLLGVKIEKNAHLFLKFGYSYMKLFSQLMTEERFNFTSIDFSPEKKTLGGFVIAMNFSYDLSRFFSVFMEYAYRAYGTTRLSQIDNIYPQGTVPDRIKDRFVRVRASSIRFGVNLLFNS